MQMPGDKSISHRAAMFAALADGTSSINNFSTSADCAATLSCLKQLGVSIERESEGLLISGVGIDGLRAPQAPVRIYEIELLGDSALAVTMVNSLAGARVLESGDRVHIDNGSLTDMNAERGERQARSDFFAGAIGSYKNSHSHRDVDLDNPDEAYELVMLANHLLRIVDQRRSAGAATALTPVPRQGDRGLCRSTPRRA